MYILLCNATLRRIIHVKCVPKAPIEPLCIIQGPFLLHRQSFPNFPSAYTIRGKGRVVVLVVDGREIKRMRFFVVREREPPPSFSLPSLLHTLIWISLSLFLRAQLCVWKCTVGPPRQRQGGRRRRREGGTFGLRYHHAWSRPPPSQLRVGEKKGLSPPPLTTILTRPILATSVISLRNRWGILW